MIQEAKTLAEKEDLFFRFMNCVSTDESTFFRQYLDSFDRTTTINGIRVRFQSPIYREAFIRDVEKNGFNIIRPPHKPLLFDDVIRLYNEFPNIKPEDIYIDLFGIQQRKMMRPGIIGYQYLIVLKQNSNKNFSARSTFRVNRSNLPAKDVAKKTNRSSYARTPVRLSEIYNLLASISGRDLAEFNVFMRSSALGRKSLDRILTAASNPLKLVKLKVKNNYTNANADILAANMKTVGIRLFFSRNKEGRTEIYNDNVVAPQYYGDYIIYDYPRTRPLYRRLFEKFNAKMKSFIMVETYRGEKVDVCWDEVFSDPEICEDRIWKEYLTEDFKENLKATTRGTVIEKNEIAKRDTNTKRSPTGEKKRRGRKPKAAKIKDEEEVEDELEEDETSEPEYEQPEPEEDESDMDSDITDD